MCSVCENVLAQSSVNQLAFQNLSFCFVDCITQGSKDLREHLPFKWFYGNAMVLINEERTDFDLDRVITPDIAAPFEEAFVRLPSQAQLQQLYNAENV
jgi:hypothetical protein